MARRIQVTVPPEQTDQIVKAMQGIDGLASLRVQRGISLQPPGDVITAETTTRAAHELTRRLEQAGCGSDPRSSFTTSEPSSLITTTQREALARDVSEATWEEIDFNLAKESNMTANGLVLMAVSGSLAVLGIASGALHLVIGAMVIAPGFEPISRISLGLVSKGRTWRHGLVHTGVGYAALILGAFLTTLVLEAIGRAPPGGEQSYLPGRALLDYWSHIKITTVMTSALAGLAGAVLIAANRSVLTAGVMIALALVPGAAIVGMGLATGELALAGRGLLRWLVDAGFVTAASSLVFAWKRARIHQRNAMV